MERTRGKSKWLWFQICAFSIIIFICVNGIANKDKKDKTKWQVSILHYLYSPLAN